MFCLRYAGGPERQFYSLQGLLLLTSKSAKLISVISVKLKPCVSFLMLYNEEQFSCQVCSVN